MVITSIRLQNYRSYSDNSFEFNKGVNVIVGPNASGKTNLMDAIYYSSTGLTIRPNKDYLIKDGAKWSRLDVLSSDNQVRIVKVNNQAHPVVEFNIDDKPYKRLGINNIKPVILFEPNQLHQITTSPEQRRIFIDGIISKIDKEFLLIKNNYLKTLRQRNSLLKQPLQEVKKQIFAWDVRLSELAGAYYSKRRQIIDLINVESSEIYSSIAGNSYRLALDYESKINIKNYSSGLLELLQSKLELDHIRGFTTYGPHRDDIIILLNDSDMRSVASRGETRSILLTLKIIESNIIESVFNKKPILLLDDVFGELDGVRRKHLINFIANHQTFITTTDADIITHDFTNQTNIVVIAN